MSNRIFDDYFDWMYKQIENPFESKEYFKLLDYLWNTDFVPILWMDCNRATDGISMRFRFAQETGYRPEEIDCYFSSKDCSVLEVIVALAVRMETTFMRDANYGDRTSQWFWTMIDNLGLHDMDDNNFDICSVHYLVDRFLNREYKKNGDGGLFKINDPSKDMRTIDIWYQMNFYLCEYSGL